MPSVAAVHHDNDDDLAAAARRRLDLLRAELRAAGLEARVRPAEPVEAGHDGPAREPDVGREGPSLAEQSNDLPQRPRPVRRHAHPTGTAGRLTGWIDDRLPEGLRGRVALGSRELAVVVVLAAVGLALAAVVVLRSGSGRSNGTDTPVAALAPLVSTPPTPSGAAGASSTPVPSSTVTTSAAEVTVDVAGRVRHPGVVRLPAGARVVDAIRKAGGTTGHVDLTSLNLAQVLSDGQQVVVGRAGAAATSPGSIAASDAATATGGPLVDINTATIEQLQDLPDVGPVTAQRILAWRQAHGTFSSVDQLLEVDGIGEKTLADMAPYVTL